MEVIITLIVVAVIVGVLAVGYYLLKPWIGGNKTAVPYPTTEPPSDWLNKTEIPHLAQKFEHATEDELARAIAAIKPIERKVEAEVTQVKTKAKRLATKAKADYTKVKATASKIRSKRARV